MNNTATNRGHTIMIDKQWEYKGHQCIIEWEAEWDYDCAKAWHTVITPEGKELIADISPYDDRKEILQMWIDAGYPKRIEIKTSYGFNSGPLSEAQLKEILKARKN